MLVRELNEETIKEYRHKIREARLTQNKIRSIRAVKDSLGFSLLDAKEYVYKNWDFLETVFSKDLPEKAGLTREFQAPGLYFRVENFQEVSLHDLDEFFGIVKLAFK